MSLSRRSRGEAQFSLQVRAVGLPEPVAEYRFHGERMWRFDFAWPALMMAVEIEGGTKINGRHNRPAGYEQDCVKYNTATSEGWRVFRFTSSMVKTGQAINFLEKFIKEKAAGIYIPSDQRGKNAN